MGRIPRIKVRREPLTRRGQSACNGLAALFNVGEKTAGWLRGAGIHSRADLQRVGPIEACRRMILAGHPVSVLAAYAFEGALMGCHWNAIPFETKQWLRAEFARMKRAQPAPRLRSR